MFKSLYYWKHQVKLNFMFLFKVKRFREIVGYVLKAHILAVKVVEY